MGNNDQKLFGEKRHFLEHDIRFRFIKLKELGKKMVYNISITIIILTRILAHNTYTIIELYRNMVIIVCSSF